MAGHARPVPDLAFRNHAAADAGGDGHSVLSPLPGRVSRRDQPCRGADRARARALEWAWLLPTRASDASRGALPSSPSTAASFRRDGRRGRAICRASAARLRRRSRRSRSARAARFSTATFNAFWRDTPPSRACPTQAKVKRALWRCAEALLPPSGIEIYTQALMDLGATVCLRAAPRCAACPVAGDCVARRDDRDRRAADAAAEKTLPRRTPHRAAARAPRRSAAGKRPAKRGLGGIVEPARARCRRRPGRALQPSASPPRSRRCHRCRRSSTALRISA